jgi:ABC-type amino acid transport system permease subunit
MEGPVNNLTWGQYKAAGRNALSYAAGGITAAAAIGLISQHDSTSLMSGLNQIASGLTSIVQGVGVIAGILAPIYAAFRAAHSASPQEQIKTVAAMPEVKGIVTTPAVADALPMESKVVATAAEIPRAPIPNGPISSQGVAAGQQNPNRPGV